MLDFWLYVVCNREFPTLIPNFFFFYLDNSALIAGFWLYSRSFDVVVKISDFNLEMEISKNKWNESFMHFIVALILLCEIVALRYLKTKQTENIFRLYFGIWGSPLRPVLCTYSVISTLSNSVTQPLLSFLFLNDFFDDGLWGEWNQNVTCLNVVISFSFSASDASGDLQTPLSSGSNVGNNHMKIQRWRGGGYAGSLWVYFPWLCLGDCVQVLPQVEALLCQSIFI